MDKITKCAACGAEIASSAKACPSCGAKVKKPIVKKWWFWVIIAVVVISIGSAMGGEKEPSVNTPDISESQSSEKNIKEYEIEGGVEGKYGKEVILNKESDMPVSKFLYKLPAGKYEVTISSGKIVQFSIVKDKITNSGTEEYPEEVDYVGSPYLLTSTDDDLNGNAKKAVQVEIKDDESVLLNSDSLHFIDIG